MLYPEVWSGRHFFQSLGQPVNHYGAILYRGSYFPQSGQEKAREADGGAAARAQLDLLSELSGVCAVRHAFLFSKKLLKWKIAINTPGDKWLKAFGPIRHNIKSSSRSYGRALEISRKWLSDLFQNNPCSMPRCCAWATNSSVAAQLKYCSVRGLHPPVSGLPSWGRQARFCRFYFFPVHTHRHDERTTRAEWMNALPII